MRYRVGLLATIAAAGTLVAAATGQAATVTVGSPLTASFASGGLGTDTLANAVLPEPGAHATSPVTGMIVRWRVLDAVGGPFRLRVLTPKGGTTYTGAGTSAPQTPASTALQTFSTAMPIQAGQTVGLNNTSAADKIGFVIVAGVTEVFWNPPLADGSTMAATGTSSNEIAFNADVVAQPAVTSLSPNSGPTSGGTTVVIAGHDLSGATAVDFGSKPAALFQSTSDGAISAVTPPGSLGTVNVKVTTPGGSSTTTAADQFTYTACVVPKLKGKKLKAAKKALRAAGCKPGKVSGAHSGKVAHQKPRAGTVLPTGSSVNIRLG